jgi:hypothetical protein
MKQLVFFFLFISSSSFAQFNDTIVFQTGYQKLVEIDSFNYNTIYYRYHNKKLDTTKSYQTTTRQVRYFVMYDEELNQTYDSKMDYTSEKPIIKVDSLKIHEHTLSVNPFVIPLLSASLRYNYIFGNFMQWAVNLRLTYINPILLNAVGNSAGILMFGAGMKFIPYYSRKMAFGLDITPMLLLDFSNGTEVGGLFPIGVNFDFYLGQRFGIALDFGAGYALSSGITGFFPRGHLGFMFNLGKTYNVPNQSNSLK